MSYCHIFATITNMWSTRRSDNETSRSPVHAYSRPSTLSGELLEQHQPSKSLAGLLGGKNVGTPDPEVLFEQLRQASEGRVFSTAREGIFHSGGSEIHTA